MKKEFSGRSPSPPVEDSEPEMTDEEKEFQLVSLTNCCWFIYLSEDLFKALNSLCIRCVFLSLDGHHKNTSDRDPSWGH